MNARKIAVERDGMMCRRCCRHIRGESSIHHRLPRGMGGSNSLAGSARVERPCNLVRLCGSGVTGCHGWIEQNRDAAYRTGWLVHRWADPAEVPILDRFGRWWRLDDHGGLDALPVGVAAVAEGEL